MSISTVDLTGAEEAVGEMLMYGDMNSSHDIHSFSIFRRGTLQSKNKINEPHADETILTS